MAEKLRLFKNKEVSKLDAVVGSSVPRAGSSWEAAGTFRPLRRHRSLDAERGAEVVLQLVFVLLFFCLFCIDS